jgi:SAM-dependent methyltransferase
MNFTGERFVPQLRGQIYYEHFHRYAVGLSIATGKDVLDIASGEGYGAAFLAMVARSVIGVDIDEASVRHAAARYPAMNLSFRVGSASQIPLADASVDMITSFETIEHLVEHEQMLHEMARVLRPNGHLLISSPNRLVYSDARGYSNPFHLRELYFHEFRDLLRGFFPEVHIYGQRIFAACAIHPIGASAVETRWLGPSLAPEPGLPGLPDAEYFVAVCGRLAGEELPNLSTVYLDLRDDLLSDVRSGGLTAADSPVPMLAGAPGRSNGTIAIASGERELSKEAVKANRVGELERLCAEQTVMLQDLAVECNRLTQQSQDLETLRSAEHDLIEQVHELERLRAEQTTISQDLAAECDRLTKQSEDLEALRSAEHDRADTAERELRVVRQREAGGRLERENFARELREVRSTEYDLKKQVNELERLRAEQTTISQDLAAEGERLTKQSLDLEALRSAEFDRADEAEREFRALRKREAEGRLDRENLARELREVSSLQAASAERGKLEAQSREAAFELLSARLSGLQISLEDATSQLAQEASSAARWTLEAQSREAVVELLSARLSDLQIALEDATSRAENVERSRSWRITAPLRQAATLIRK